MLKERTLFVIIVQEEIINQATGIDNQGEGDRGCFKENFYLSFRVIH